MPNDGTQDPVPPPVLADPLAGLVTGTRYEPEPLRVRVTEPPLPDISLMREAMASVLDDDSELNIAAITQAADYFTDSSGDAPAETAPPAEPAPNPAQDSPAPVAQVPVSEVPKQAPGQTAPEPATTRVTPPATRPTTSRPGTVPTRGAVTRVPPPGIPAPRRGESSVRELPPAITPGEKTRLIRLPRGFMRRPPTMPQGGQGQSSAGSLSLIFLLLLVMAVLGIVFLASLIDTIASVFD